MSWDGWPQAVHKGFLILPILGCVRCNEDERRHREVEEGAQVFQWKPKRSVCRRIQIRWYSSSPRKDKSGYEERLEGIAESSSSAPHLPNASAASFSGRNECPGTHCSLIEQEEREDSSCQICQRD